MKPTELDDTADGGTPQASAVLAKGSTLGKYRLDRVLGEGGMGVVWAAHDPDLERAVAIKVLRYAQAAVQLRQRLLREARAMAKLKHPNVLTVYEVGTVGDRDYIAMELVDGMSVDQWLALEPPESEIWAAILAAGRGLAAAHDAGVVHRDFKPHNVLRSRDGRVLVTDFGLARGLLGEDEVPAVDPPALADTSATPELDATMQAPAKRSDSGTRPRESDSLLDAPLTQTGALIGTPAYMSPEQYRGDAPDPHTDQFAFCVTAWQALTGERPFKGQTIEEMRASVGGGVAHIQTKLPRDVRAALARGLHPDAKSRWPSLEALLDELDRVVSLPARRRRLLMTGAALAVIAASAIFVIARRTDAIVTACDAPEDAFAEAWSPAIRSELQRAPGIVPDTFARVADAFDQFRERWIVTYQKACRTRSSKVFPQRVRCLEGVRDQVSVLTFMLKSAPPSMYRSFDAHGILPNIGGCERADPETPPVFPRDQPRRSNVVAIMARAITLRQTPVAALDSSVAALEHDAVAVGWTPAVPQVLFVAGSVFLRHDQVAKARTFFKRALQNLRDATTKDRHFEATTYVALADAAVQELAQPGVGVPARLNDAHAEPILHPELRDAFSAALSAGKDDDMLLGGVAALQAEAYMRLAQWNRYRSAYAEAIHYAQEARRLLEGVGDARRGAIASAQEAQIYLERGDDRALDDALFAARRGADAIEAGQLRPVAMLDEILVQIAFARPNYAEVHRILDKAGAPTPATQATITGRVDPPGRALVVAWSGALDGDPKRAYTDPKAIAFDAVESDETGAFTIHAEAGFAIMAERGDARSTPQLVDASPSLSLAMRPTRTVSGTATGRNFLGVSAFAMIKLGSSSWTVEVPIANDGRFDLRGLPATGDFVFGTIGDAGDALRRVMTGANATQLTWPYGQAIDAIVRGDVADDATVWVMRGAVTPAPATRAAVETLATTRGDVATAQVHAIGRTNTDAGRALYQPGDHHAVITGNATEMATVCVAPRGGNDAPVVCQTIDVKPSLVIEYPDGRFAAGVTPIVLEP